MNGVFKIVWVMVSAYCGQCRTGTVGDLTPVDLSCIFRTENAVFALPGLLVCVKM